MTSIVCEWKYKERLDNLVDQVTKMHKQYATYGFYREQGKHPNNPHLNYPTLMAMHELRDKSDPEYRPVFQISLRKGSKKFHTNNFKSVKKFINGSALLKRRVSVKNLLDEIADNGARITYPTFGNATLLKPNDPKWARRKGGNTPMIEDSHLRKALATKTSLRKSVKRFKK